MGGVPAIPANCRDTQWRAVGSNHASEALDIDTNGLQEGAGVLVDLVGFLGGIAALDLARVALRDAAMGGSSRACGSESEESSSGGKGDDASEHLA
jgi:hypothetical protein